MSKRHHAAKSAVLSYNVHCKECGETFTRQDAQTGKVIKILDEMYHFNCFKCLACQKVLGVAPSYPKTPVGPFRCADCFREATSPRCHGCKKATFEKCVAAFDVYWHEGCFKCKGCNKPFKRQEYVVHEGCAYDEDCYYRYVEGVVTPQRGEIRE
ncbi:unnamed protein product [Caenorhabditis sp. 36 PRJEB53466]|nr:unnamed protein product [Caenorhabditis sp. 36 PRJEB53466]